MLPRTSDCNDLVSAIDYVASFPSELQPKTWGRVVPDTPTTQSLPKIYYYDAPGPVHSTCAVEVDVDPEDVWAVEVFTLKRVEVAAGSIVDKCLEDNRLVGLATLGKGGKVQARIMRTDRPMFRGVGQPLRGVRGGRLWVVEGEKARRLVRGGGVARNGTVGET